eukprot:2542148-Pyramimonas_sp.AAC.1
MRELHRPPPWQANRPATPPRGERPRGRPPREDQPREEHLEGGMQRLVGYAEAGLARQYMPPDKMQHWLDQVWTGHQIRHWHSLRIIKRGEDGEIIRSTSGGARVPGGALLPNGPIAI